MEELTDIAYKEFVRVSLGLLILCHLFWGEDGEIVVCLSLSFLCILIIFNRNISSSLNIKIILEN